MSYSRATDTFTRPADATQYTAGDLVANSTTAGSVEALSFTTTTRAPALVKSVSLYHSDQDATGSTFRVWLLSANPTVTNGDNGALAGIDAATVLGTVEITADENCGDTFGMTSSEGILVPANFWAVIEATGTYTPASGETFGVSIVLGPTN